MNLVAHSRCSCGNVNGLVSFDYKLFKHLCRINGINISWKDRIDLETRIKEVMG